jgi:hypothetical protein
MADDEVIVFSNNGADVSRTFPELGGTVARTGSRPFLMGEQE